MTNADRALHPRLIARWTDDPADPGRLPLTWPSVQRLIEQVAPGSHATDLGGVMSLNVGLTPPGATEHALVLRIHQGHVTKPRLLAVQEVRRRLAATGLLTPVPLSWRDQTVFRCARRWAELECYLPNERPPATPESNIWLFAAMGRLHRALRSPTLAHTKVPPPPDATYAPPGTLRRWLPVTAAAARSAPDAAEIVRGVREQVRRLERHWVPARDLPVQLTHGDVRLSNVRRVPAGHAPAGATIYLDFGFLAVRPRVHDVAYALAFMVWALDGLDAPDRFSWDLVPQLIAAYETADGIPLSPLERRALAPYTAAVPLHKAALDGFTEDPPARLRTRIPFLRLSEWLLAHPDALLG